MLSVLGGVAVRMGTLSCLSAATGVGVVAAATAATAATTAGAAGAAASATTRPGGVLAAAAAPEEGHGYVDHALDAICSVLQLKAADARQSSSNDRSSDASSRIFVVDLNVNGVTAPIVFDRQQGGQTPREAATEYCALFGTDDAAQIAYVEQEIETAIRKQLRLAEGAPLPPSPPSSPAVPSTAAGAAPALPLVSLRVSVDDVEHEVHLWPGEGVDEVAQAFGRKLSLSADWVEGIRQELALQLLMATPRQQQQQQEQQEQQEQHASSRGGGEGVGEGRVSEGRESQGTTAPPQVEQVAALLMAKAQEEYDPSDPSAVLVTVNVNDIPAHFVYRLGGGLSLEEAAREYLTHFGTPDDKAATQFVLSEMDKAVTLKEKDRTTRQNKGKDKDKVKGKDEGKGKKDVEAGPDAQASQGGKASSSSAPKKERTSEKRRASSGGSSKRGWGTSRRSFSSHRRAAVAFVASTGVLRWDSLLSVVIVGAVVFLVKLYKEEARKIEKKKACHLPSKVPRPLSMPEQARRFLRRATSPVGEKLRVVECMWGGASPAVVSPTAAAAAATATQRGKTRKGQSAGEKAVEESDSDNSVSPKPKGGLRRGRGRGRVGEGEGGEGAPENGEEGDASSSSSSSATEGGKKVRFKEDEQDKQDEMRKKKEKEAEEERKRKKAEEEFSWEGFLTSALSRHQGLLHLKALSNAGAVLAETEGLRAEMHETSDWVRLTKSKKVDIVFLNQRYGVSLREEGVLMATPKGSPVSNSCPKLMSAKAKSALLLAAFTDLSKTEARETLEGLVAELKVFKR